MITDNIPLLRSKGFNSPPLTTHRSTSKNGGESPLNGKVCGMRMVLYEGSTPCFSLRLLSMRVPNIDGHPNAIVGKFRTLDVLGRVLVDLLHLTRRLGKPNLLPHLYTGGDFLRLGHGRALPIFILYHSSNILSSKMSHFFENISSQISKKLSSNA